MAARTTALIGAAAYAGLLATTRPFTLPADLVTAAALVVAAAAMATRLLSGRPAPAVPQGGAQGDEAAGATTVLPWVVLAGAVLAWELFCYFGAPRSAHPTISSIYDALARWRAAKAAVVLAWVALGWALVRR